MSYYYALWIPQTKIGYPTIITEHQEVKRLKDDPEDDVPAIELSGYIDTTSYDIHIAYSCDGNTAKELFFKLIKKTKHGFLVYKLDLAEEDNDYLCNIIRKEGLHNSIYHYIKRFFHEHTYHDATDDSLLTPFSSEEPVDIDDNECLRALLNNYLNRYELKYSGYVEETRDTLNTITKRLVHSTSLFLPT